MQCGEVHSEGKCDLFFDATTQSTCNLSDAVSTDCFYAEESDASDDSLGSSDSETESTSGIAEILVGDSISTLPTEIAELDTIGFEESIHVDESVET